MTTPSSAKAKDGRLDYALTKSMPTHSHTRAVAICAAMAAFGFKGRISGASIDPPSTR